MIRRRLPGTRREKSKILQCLGTFSRNSEVAVAEPCGGGKPPTCLSSACATEGPEASQASVAVSGRVEGPDLELPSTARGGTLPSQGRPVGARVPALTHSAVALCGHHQQGGRLTASPEDDWQVSPALPQGAQRSALQVNWSVSGFTGDLGVDNSKA